MDSGLLAALGPGMTDAGMQESTVAVRDWRLRVVEAGQGPTMLYLHGATGASWNPLLEQLSANCRVIAPEHPGFGHSQIPGWMMSAGDLAFFYLDVLKSLDLRDVHLVGHCVGGWIAAELAVRSTARLKTLTLLAPAGVGSAEASFGDVFLWTHEEFARHQFHDPVRSQEDIRALAGADIDVLLQNRAAVARIGWSPRLENMQLRHWLHRIDIPTLLIWGKDDEIAPFACHRPYVEEIRGAEFLTLPQSGHALPIERADGIAQRLAAFVNGARG
jgi:pimeloyl-ACP methyl ester carboxylesterase